MNRRRLLKSAAVLPGLAVSWPEIAPAAASGAAAPTYPARRVRPVDPAWPSPASWAQLNRGVAGRLIKVQSPLAACQNAPNSDSCREVFKELKKPFYIGDQPALTQTSGWVDGWTSSPSVYAVAATKTQDVVAAVNFARENNLRLVIKGGGHSYQGTSCSADSLLIWTRAMNEITLHDAFVAQGYERKQAPQPGSQSGRARCGARRSAL
jgi:hypothetical protein